MPDIEERVFEFVAELTGAERRRLTLATTLVGDLGVDGDDGWDLVESFGEKFEVDLSTFRGDEHFGPEGLSIFAPLGLVWSLVSWPFRKKQTPEESAGLRASLLAAW